MNFAFYCSGSASRVLKFYKKNSYSAFSSKFVIYDGESQEVVDKLERISSDLIVVHFKKIVNRNETKNIDLSDKILSLVQIYKIDYLFCFGDKILRKNLVSEMKNRIVNFHPSLLPSFPGLYAIDKALETSVQILGNTAHFIDEGIDTGPIILQSAISRHQYNDYEDVLGLQLEMLRKIWCWLDSQLVEVLDNKVTILGAENKDEVYFTN